jgi:hypothetical protein
MTLPRIETRFGRVLLVGLTLEETIEFEAIDALPPVDESGSIAWIFEGEPTRPRERRWLELYVKQRKAAGHGPVC